VGTVYVTQIPSRITDGAWIPTVDVSPARVFGELKVMLPSGINYAEAAPVVLQLRGLLRDFDPDNDFLLAVGDPVVMAVAAALIGNEHDYFTLLKWDRRQARYLPYEVKMYGA
jgi:hypothetical protein